MLVGRIEDVLNGSFINLFDLLTTVFRQNVVLQTILHFPKVENVGKLIILQDIDTVTFK